MQVLKRGAVIQRMYQVSEGGDDVATYEIGGQYVARETVDLRAEFKAWAAREKHLDSAGNLKPGHDENVTASLFLAAMVQNGRLEETTKVALFCIDRRGVTTIEE